MLTIPAVQSERTGHGVVEEVDGCIDKATTTDLPPHDNEEVLLICPAVGAGREATATVHVDKSSSSTCQNQGVDASYKACAQNLSALFYKKPC